ncbi:MAG: methylmalonyl Co-A mutase-associated GTPase MeaB [Bacteroidetes bacterium]|nr:MAG: methylmalonyl Co-A mutase-associated GTPase MeaB [Bacteroidota bacterium]
MADRKEQKSALNVMEGIEQPSQINKEAIRKLKSGKRKPLSVGDFVKGIREGNRTILSKAITLIESSLASHQEKAQQIIAECLLSLATDQIKGKRQEARGNIENRESRIEDGESSIQHPVSSIRIGITGVPGVGKSTFIEAFGKYLTAQGYKLAVLAIDPSSSRSKGSILGDKTRMEELANDPDAFIRPSPSAGSLGGVARKTRETIILCEAAGFDVILVETVGVGQSETAVHSMVDFFLLLILAGAGDELQGIKRGIIEMADAIFINKADGDNIAKANLAKAEYFNALHLFPPPESGWIPVVETCSAHTREGITRVWEIINDFCTFTSTKGFFTRRRMEQDRQVLFEAIDGSLKTSFYSRKDIAHQLKKMETDVVAGKVNPYIAAKELLEKYYSG